MILTPEIRTKILATLQAQPDKPLILPDFCYPKNSDHPVVYVDQLPERLTRVLYAELVGPIPDGQALQQRPDVPARNVNPHLLQLVDGHGGKPNAGDVNRAKTHCNHNHPLEGENLLILKNGRRRCRTCHRENMARYRATDEKGTDNDPRHRHSARGRDRLAGSPPPGRDRDTGPGLG